MRDVDLSLRCIQEGDGTMSQVLVPVPHIADMLLQSDLEQSGFFMMMGDTAEKQFMLESTLYRMDTGLPILPSLRTSDLHSSVWVRKADKPCPLNFTKKLSLVWKVPGSNTNFSMTWPFLFSSPVQDSPQKDTPGNTMSAFSIRKQSPSQSDNKSPSVAIKSRQQANHDINKRRTLLQDNSWIKKRPEEESADENYGRAVLNQYKSQDSLHSSSTNEKEDQKAALGRYRSDTTLDRIPARSDTEKINKSPTLNNKQNNRQSWTPNAPSTNTAVTSPIKKKRQSWMPPAVSSSKTTTETVETKQTTSENSEAPTTAAVSSEQVTPQKSKADVDDQATTRDQDLDNVIKVNSSSFTSDKEGKDLEDFTEINAAGQKNKRDQDLGGHTEVKSADDQNKKRTTKQAYENPPRAPNNLPEIKYSSDSQRKTSKSSYGAYEENITGNTIKTVYSTSDRSIIGKDICTYCRKPLGIDAKMILDALQICCHSTCFKCEVCKRPLEDLKAGDSIWIYRQTVHCEPCYSKIKEKWIY